MSKGYKHTIEWKEQASKRMGGNTFGFKKGKPSWNAGTKKHNYCIDCKKEIQNRSKRCRSCSCKGELSYSFGKKHDPAWKEKMSKLLKGKPRPQWVRDKISLGSRNKKRPKWSGENCPSWKGGSTSKNQIIRSSIEFRIWREGCFAIDNFTCQKCQKRGGDLEAHHINNFAEFPELRFALDNGITFCKKCHRVFHKKYSNKNNNINQLKEFICQI